MRTPADIAFVPMEPCHLAWGRSAADASALHRPAGGGQARSEDEVALLMPRIIDVLNGYLRAVEVAELEDPTRWCGCGRRCCAGFRSSPAKAGCATCLSPNSCFIEEAADGTDFRYSDGAGAFGAAIYCYVLSRPAEEIHHAGKRHGQGDCGAVGTGRRHDQGAGPARGRRQPARPTPRIDDRRAEAAAARMELLLASMHDLPEPEPARRPAAPDDAEADEREESALHPATARPNLEAAE